MKNSRFTVATHILALLMLTEERRPGEPAKSHIMAGSINTNPIVVRRILKQLRDAGLVEGRPLPLVSLGDMAVEYRDAERARALYTRAAQENREAAEPWLKLVDLYRTLNRREEAVRMLEQAELRNADEATVKALKEELGVRATDPAAGPRSIIRR